jgi:hypothetical protein
MGSHAGAVQLSLKLTQQAVADARLAFENSRSLESAKNA